MAREYGDGSESSINKVFLGDAAKVGSYMPSNLIVNPFLQLRPVDDSSSSLILLAPKPGQGLVEFDILRASNPSLFDLFTELAKTKFSFLNPEKDLNEADRVMLFENGILVDPEAIPKRPLFSCSLDNVPEHSEPIDPDRLIVNPSFWFEAFDLTRFSYFARERGLSPFRPSAWIKSPFSQIELGYWLTNEQAAIIGSFVAGQSLSEPLEGSLLRKLVAAEILITTDSLNDAHDRLQQSAAAANAKFAAEKYVVLPNLLPEPQMDAMRQYYRDYVANGFMPFGDGQVDRRYCEHNEVLASFIHSQLLNVVSKVVGEPLKLSYVYAAAYEEGSELLPHIDREQCEYSISFQVDFEPETDDLRSLWPIFVEPLTNFTTPLDDDVATFQWDKFDQLPRKVEPSSILLACGDGLIYKGRELVHYRRKLPQGQRSTSLFFHYVTADFEGRLH